MTEPRDALRARAWRDKPLAVVIRHLVDDHHAFARAELARLDELSRRAQGLRGEVNPQLTQVRALLGALSDDLRPHLRKEEQVLFPYLEALEAASGAVGAAAPFRSVENPSRMMDIEHEQMLELLQRLRKVTSGYRAPDGTSETTRVLYAGMRALDADLMVHLHLESDVLFPRARKLEAARNAAAKCRGVP